MSSPIASSSGKTLITDTFQPRQEISPLNKPFQKTIALLNGSSYPNANRIYGITLFALGVLSALALTILTLGVGALLLTKEWAYQKEESAYNSGKRYQEKSDAVTITNLNKEIQGLNEDIQNHENQKKDLQKTVENLKLELEENKKDLESKQAKINSSKNKQHFFTMAAEDHKRIENLERQIEHLFASLNQSDETDSAPASDSENSSNSDFSDNEKKISSNCVFISRSDDLSTPPQSVQ